MENIYKEADKFLSERNCKRHESPVAIMFDSVEPHDVVDFANIQVMKRLEEMKEYLKVKAEKEYLLKNLNAMQIERFSNEYIETLKNKISI